MDIPFIPEFSDYKVRNQWIKDHAQLWTVIRRKHRSYEREEYFSFDEAVDRAKIIIGRYQNARLLIYAVCAGHDTLAATVSSDGVKHHD